MADEEQSIEERYEDLVRYLAGHLLGTDEFEVKSKSRGSQLTILLHAPEELRGRVIGRGGRIARSIRTILDGATFDDSLSISLDIVD